MYYTWSESCHNYFIVNNKTITEGTGCARTLINKTNYLSFRFSGTSFKKKQHVKMTNPATIPTPVKDIQGDGRWMSMVSIYLKLSSA